MQLDTLVRQTYVSLACCPDDKVEGQGHIVHSAWAAGEALGQGVEIVGDVEKLVHLTDSVVARCGHCKLEVDARLEVVHDDEWCYCYQKKGADGCCFEGLAGLRCKGDVPAWVRIYQGQTLEVLGLPP